MPTFTAGVDYSDTVGVTTHTATSENLGLLISDATLSGLTRTEVWHDAQRIIERVSGAPFFLSEAADSNPWYDTDLDQLRFGNSTTFDSVKEGPGLVNSNATVTLPRGAVSEVSNSTKGADFSNENERADIAGISLSALGPGGTEQGIFGQFGLLEVLCMGPIRPGDLLTTSASATGHAVTATRVTANMLFTANIVIGVATASVGSGVSTLATQMLWV